MATSRRRSPTTSVTARAEGHIETSHARPQAALLSLSTWRNHSSSRFQLTKMRLNSLTRVRSLIRVDLAGPNFERSRPDATHGNCHLLLALGPTIECLTAFAEVIERCGDR